MRGSSGHTFDAGRASGRRKHSQGAPRSGSAPAAASTPPALAARVVYRPLSELAEACGVPAYKLQTTFWPEEFAVPRDWVWVGSASAVLVNVASGGLIVRELKSAGRVCEAAKLELWMREREACTAPAADGAWFRKGQYA